MHTGFSTRPLRRAGTIDPRGRFHPVVCFIPLPAEGQLTLAT